MATSDGTRLARLLEVGAGPLHSVAWSPDGTRLAVGGGDGVSVLTSEGERLWRWDVRFPAFSVAWSPDGSLVAAGGSTGFVWLLNASTGVVTRRWQGHQDTVHSLAFCTRGRLISGSTDGSARIWDGATGNQLQNCRSTASIGAAISPDGVMIAMGDRDAVLLCDALTGSQVMTCRGNTLVGWLAFSNDGSMLASSGADGTLRVWDPRTGVAIVRCAAQWKGGTYGVTFSPDGTVLASCGQAGKLGLWEARTGRFLAFVGTHGSAIAWSVAFSPDGSCLASASADGTAILWDVSQWVAPSTVRPREDTSDWIERQAETVGRRPQFNQVAPWIPSLRSDDVVGCVGVLADGKARASADSAKVVIEGRTRTLFSGHPDGTVRSWNLESGAPRWANRGDGLSRIRCIALSPDGRALATGATGLQIWEPRTGDELLRISDETVTGLSWSPDSRTLAGACTRFVKVWDAQSGSELFRCDGRIHLRGVAFSPVGHMLASGDGDGVIHVWSASSGEDLFRCEGHQGFVHSVVFSPDGLTIVSCGADKTIRLWDTQSGTELRRCNGHTANIDDVVFMPNGRVLASASDDRSIRLWDAVTGEETHRLDFPEDYAWKLSFSHDGAFLASGHPGDVIRLWDTRPFVGRASVALPDGPAEPIDPGLAPLPSAWAALERAGLHLPLSLARDLLALTAGHEPESLTSVAEHPGVRRLASLGWPTNARVGLVALLAHKVRGEEWVSPSSQGTAELRQLLERALGGARVEHRPAQVPVSLLTEAAGEIDDRTMTMLYALGRDTVAADPSLVLSMRSHARALLALTESQRRLLERPLLGSDSGQAQGAGTGAERGGIAPRGPLTAILSSQLVYPPDLLALKHHEGGLLYRARTGRQRPKLRPAVLLLDVSPGCFGPVESITRPAAFSIAQALRRRGLPVRLVALGGQAKVRTLELPRDLLDLLMIRSLQPVETALALRTAGRAAAELAAETGGSALILLLTHPYWGAEVTASARTPGLRALFVQYPGQQVRPAFASQCERWESIGAGESERLSQVLGRLVA